MAIETIEYRTHDKSTWPRGEWDHEPDKKQWSDPTTGYACLIVRNRYGALCGYVGVPEGHPYHGSDYGAIDEFVRVHGGLTFSGPCSNEKDEQDHDPSIGICHLDPGGRPVWWLGFDCAHAFDLCPNFPYPTGVIRIPSHRPNDEYRNLAYVTAEVTDLATQLKALESKHDPVLG